MKRLLRASPALMLAAIFSLVSACATIGDQDSTVRLAAMYATIKVINGDTRKAERVEEIASQVQAYASDEKFLTIDLLVDQVRELVNWDKLDAADTLLVDALLMELRSRLEERLGTNVLPEDLRLAVNTVAGWVISAARMT